MTRRVLVPLALPFIAVAATTLVLVFAAEQTMEGLREVLTRAHRHMQYQKDAQLQAERCIERGGNECDLVATKLQRRLSLIEARRELTKSSPDENRIDNLLGEAGVSRAELSRARWVGVVGTFLRWWPSSRFSLGGYSDVPTLLAMAAQAKSEHAKADPDPAVFREIQMRLNTLVAESERGASNFEQEVTEASYQARRTLYGIVGLTTFAIFLAASLISRNMLNSVDAKDRELRESEARFRALADNIAQLAWMADGDGRISWYNRRWREFAGRPSAENQIQQFNGLVHPDHGERVRSTFERCVATGEPWEETFPVRAQTGQYRWFLSRAQPIHSEGPAVTRWFGTCTDITAEKQIESALRRSNQDLEQFAYVATHDLREPLRNIATHAELLRRSYGEDNHSDRKRYIDVVTNSAVRMQDMLTSLLNYSRVVRDREAEYDLVDLAGALEQAKANLEAALRETGAQVISRRLPVVRGDLAQLVQVFQNLIANSIRYRRECVRTMIRIEVEELPDEWLLSVADNGSGFKQQYAQQIFGIFKRLHGTEVPGSGIGLSIVQAVIDRHGGRTWAEGRPDEGATFFFTLPRI